MRADNDPMSDLVASESVLETIACNSRLTPCILCTAIRAENNLKLEFYKILWFQGCIKLKTPPLEF